jgi:hypothetical protein
MNTTEKYLILACGILTILCGLLGYIDLKKPKVITKTETKIETKEVVKYIHDNATVTGATKVTILQNGTQVIQGTNLTIVSTTTVTATSTTHVTDVVKEKFSRTAIMLGAFDSGSFKDYGLNLGLQVDNYEFTVGYGINRKEWDFDVKTTLLAW